MLSKKKRLLASKGGKMYFPVPIIIAPMLFVLSHTISAEEKTGHEVATTLLEHLGDPEIWAKAKGARIMEVHISKWSRLPYTHEVWIDFTAPRVLVRVKNQDLRQMRSMNHDEGWWIQEGEIDPYKADFLEDEFKRWRTSPYRILHLAARNDPALNYEMLEVNILQIALEGTPVIRFVLDTDGHPTGFRRYNNNFATLTVLEPLVAYDAVNLWREARTPDSTFRSLNLEFQLYMDPPDISFDPPENLNDLSR